MKQQSASSTTAEVLDIRNASTVCFMESLVVVRGDAAESSMVLATEGFVRQVVRVS
jgi:hypothetical protein